uniref:Uncharacterized protein n=1 Tax=Romanomermis culicivorax TaxID=13658 RepID=A0A915IPT9_ROMCU
MENSAGKDKRSLWGRITYYVWWLHLQYLLTTGLYMLEPWERALFNIVVISLLSILKIMNAITSSEKQENQKLYQRTTCLLCNEQECPSSFLLFHIRNVHLHTVEDMPEDKRIVYDKYSRELSDVLTFMCKELSNSSEVLGKSQKIATEVL